MLKRYDVIVIGSGPGGYVAAIRSSQLGKKACVVDVSEARLGGVCLNEGCIPAKSLIYSSKLFSSIKKANDFGLDAEVKPPDMKKITASSQKSAFQLRSGLKGLFKKYGIEFIIGKAKLIGRNEVGIEISGVREEKIDADKIIIAAGSRPKAIPNIETDGEIILTSSEAIKLENVPKTFLIIGAGAVGVEFAALFASFGAKVTLIEAMPGIIPFEDEEISKALLSILKKKGIEALVNTKVKALEKGEASVKVVLAAGGSVKTMEFESILIAVGRRPNTDGIGLEDIGIRLEKGFIVTDHRMRTSIDNIYAVGDVVNTPMYAHVAYKEGIVAAEDIAGIKTEAIDYENVPSVVFSEPQVAGVGLTEPKAKELGYDIAVSKQFFKANGMAVAARRDEGFIKIIADKKSKSLLGVHIIGGDAAEILHEFVIAKNSKLKVDDIAKAVHAHPTFSEIAQDAARAVFGKPIHG